MRTVWLFMFFTCILVDCKNDSERSVSERDSLGQSNSLHFSWRFISESSEAARINSPQREEHNHFPISSNEGVSTPIIALVQMTESVSSDFQLSKDDQALKPRPNQALQFLTESLDVVASANFNFTDIAQFINNFVSMMLKDTFNAFQKRWIVEQFYEHLFYKKDEFKQNGSQQIIMINDCICAWINLNHKQFAPHELDMINQLTIIIKNIYSND